MDELAFWVYLSLIALSIALCRWAVRRSDPTAALPLPPVPETPEPYELAYLRNGAEEVARVAVFSLLERGYLRPTRTRQDSPDPQMERAPDATAPRLLDGLERRVLDWFSRPRTERESFRSPHALPAAIEPWCSPYLEQLQGQGLLTSSRMWAAAGGVWLASFLGLLVFVALHGARVGREERDPAALFGALLVALISLLQIANFSSPGRTTSRGRAYLEQLQRAFEPLNESVRTADSADHTALLLLVALFGPTGALSGTARERYLALLVPQVAESNCGGCGG